MGAAGGLGEFVVGAAEFDGDAIDNGADAGFADGVLGGVAGLVGGEELDGDFGAVGEFDGALLADLQIGNDKGHGGGEEEEEGHRRILSVSFGQIGTC